MSAASLTYPRPKTLPKPRAMFKAEAVALGLLHKVQIAGQKSSLWYLYNPVHYPIITAPTFHYIFPSGDLSFEDPSTWAFWVKIHPELACKQFILTGMDEETDLILEHALHPQYLEDLTLGHHAQLPAVLWLLSQATQLKTLNFSLRLLHKVHLSTWAQLPALSSIHTLTLSSGFRVLLNLPACSHLHTLILHHNNSGTYYDSLQLEPKSSIPDTVTYLEIKLSYIPCISNLGNIQTLVFYGYPEAEDELEALQLCTSVTTLEIHPLHLYMDSPDPEMLLGDLHENYLPNVTTLKLHNLIRNPVRWSKTFTPMFCMNSDILKTVFPSLSFLYTNPHWNAQQLRPRHINRLKAAFSAVDQHNPQWSFEIKGFLKATKAQRWEVAYLV
ncbi:hypothetical protein PHLGIDRAFT_509249 [Phlebiopsis gigantea 11061_1 CR5-6]|uniref:Uncharacterized protein n=1 Tax=Phlebiopsis gigantea (strain 11061_1 CR5-6) TaxID=745531 RepID=A0A0C3S168_PHLG1|nr:hypothetical protein PHLGIDRAFT_509249 [Phlebiopsis gigantea 11061_1 CR5-6]